MKRINIIILMLILGSSCQHNKSFFKKQKPTRSLANNSVMRIFLQEVANRSKSLTITTIEDQALRYIKSYNSSASLGNWEQIGITKQQAQAIKSIYDDAPHMNKVRKWLRHNITKVTSIKSVAAQEAFEVIMRGKRNYINPYKFHAQGATSMVSSRRKSISPFDSISEHRKRVAAQIDKLTESFKKASKSSVRQIKELQKTYKEALVIMIRRGKKIPSLLANGNEIIESACKITQKTGRPGMGQGCKRFNETASESIIANKADIDQLRAQIIEQKAYDKAGKYFGTFNEVPSNLRLTQTEIDDATIEAFKRINAMTDDEARMAVQRLKQKPCKIY